MFSGKTEALIRRLADADASGRKALAVKPSFDLEPEWLVSLSGLRWPAKPVEDPAEIMALASDLDFIAIDEAQFFSGEIVRAVQRLATWSEVMAAGLDLDFRGQPFGFMRALAGVADSVVGLTAVCAQCGGVATRSQRLINGRPARADAPLVQLGGSELYEPRCLRCHQVA
jgi:thymidine kinase